MKKKLKNCPVCNTSLEIREYCCPSCETTIKGKFSTSDFEILTFDQFEFVKVFLCCQGNIKEVEKAMGISYPTVKNKLNEIIRIICPEAKRNSENYLNLLDEIEKGNISVNDALILMEKK